MEKKALRPYLSVHRFNKIPFLIHGFGTIQWRESDLKGWTREGEYFRIFSLRQVHSNIVRIVKRETKSHLDGDAAVTPLPFIFLVIKTADCLPILIVDEKKRIIAACHSGWQGTAKKIAEAVVQTMEAEFAVDPSSLLVALGPSIGHDCYEVGEEVRQLYRDNGHSDEIFRNHPRIKGKHLLDLRRANIIQLKKMGVPEENIFSLPLCTHCSSNFYSYRRQKKSSGRLINFIGMSFSGNPLS